MQGGEEGYTTDLRSKCRRLSTRSEKLRGFRALDVFDFLVVEETDWGAAPDYPCSIMLFPFEQNISSAFFPFPKT